MSQVLVIPGTPPSRQDLVEHRSWMGERAVLTDRRRRTKSGEAFRAHFTIYTYELSNPLGGQVLANVPYNCWSILPLFHLSRRGDFTGFAFTVVPPSREDKCKDDEREDGEDARKESGIGTAQQWTGQGLGHKSCEVLKRLTHDLRFLRDLLLRRSVENPER
jgi:hypothetical protein